MNKLKSLFMFTKQQRRGILSLITLMVLIQISYFIWASKKTTLENESDTSWLAMQTVIDSLKNKPEITKTTIYPFNPNFITDYKGYKLGMKLEEINRLHAYREQNKFVNSAKEFQNVTGVSDSLLNVISPYFKFPDWVNKQKNYPNYKENIKFQKVNRIVQKDINDASSEDLIKLYGIGPALSDRILKQKEQLGGFVSMKQMESIWGLSPEVIENLNKYFVVESIPSVKKININSLSTKELAKFPYFNYTIAKEVVTFRSMNGEIKSIEDLAKIKGFPVEKIEFIALYLEF
jgi:DNA uptake protein ComE-like DNA-binding protein